MVHEHFHQLQFSWPGYYTGTAALGLDGGDQTGMWMLNYSFPYDNVETAGNIATMAQALAVAIEARGSASFQDAVFNYLTLRAKTEKSVSSRDWAYLELQLWQEGVARWTENRIGRESSILAATALESNLLIFNSLQSIDLARQQRSAFYPIGAAEAMILEALNVDWRSRYWSEPFQMKTLFQNFKNVE